MKQRLLYILFTILLFGCAHSETTSYSPCPHDPQPLFDEITSITTCIAFYNLENDRWPFSFKEIKTFIESNKLGFGKNNETATSIINPLIALNEKSKLKLYPVSDDTIKLFYTSQYRYNVKVRLFLVKKSNTPDSKKFSLNLNVLAEPLETTGLSPDEAMFVNLLGELVIRSLFALLEGYSKR